MQNIFDLFSRGGGGVSQNKNEKFSGTYCFRLCATAFSLCILLLGHSQPSVNICELVPVLSSPPLRPIVSFKMDRVLLIHQQLLAQNRLVSQVLLSVGTAADMYSDFKLTGIRILGSEGHSWPITCSCQ